MYANTLMEYEIEELGLELPGPTQRNSPLDVAKDPTILALLKYVPRGKYMCRLEKIIGDKQNKLKTSFKYDW